MKTIPLAEAVAMIPDGARLMIGGFMGVGTPERLVDEIVLSVIANDNAKPGTGIGKLVNAKLVRAAIVSHVGLPCAWRTPLPAISSRQYLLSNEVVATPASSGAQ